MSMEWWVLVRAARFIIPVERTRIEGMEAQRMQAVRFRAQETTHLVALAPCILTNFPPLSAPVVQTPATPRSTRNISNSRKSYTRSKTKTGKSFSSNRKRSTSN